MYILMFIFRLAASALCSFIASAHHDSTEIVLNSFHIFFFIYLLQRDDHIFQHSLIAFFYSFYVVVEDSEAISRFKENDPSSKDRDDDDYDNFARQCSDDDERWQPSSH